MYIASDLGCENFRLMDFLFEFIFRNLHTSRNSCSVFDNIINHDRKDFEILVDNFIDFGLQRRGVPTTVGTTDLLAVADSICSACCAEASPTGPTKALSERTS